MTPDFDAAGLVGELHPVEYLWGLLEQLRPEHYPPGVIPVGPHYRGTAGFSAGAGLFRDPSEDALPRFPVGGIMFVGHNLDSEDNYRDWIARHVDPGIRMPYWRKVKLLLAAAEIEPHEAFFTNYFVGLKRGASSQGHFPGADDESFARWCDAFLNEQIRVMRPAVAAFGTEPRQRLDCAGNDPIGRVRGGVELTLIGLTHPSYGGYQAQRDGRPYFRWEAERLQSAIVAAGRG